MSDRRWVTLTVTQEELELIDGAKADMETLLGLPLSRSTFLKRILFASMLEDTSLRLREPQGHSKTVQMGLDGSSMEHET